MVNGTKLYCNTKEKYITGETKVADTLQGKDYIIVE